MISGCLGALLISVLIVHTLSNTVDFRVNNFNNIFRDIVMENKKNFNNTFPDVLKFCSLRIVGGTRVSIKEIPYQVVIRKSSISGNYWTAFCGGSLVTLKHVLTAAHCFMKLRSQSSLNKIVVVAGTSLSSASTMYMSSYEQFRRILRYYQHINFTLIYIKHDIGVVEVIRSFYAASNVKPIRIHSPELNLKLNNGLQCLVSGYGYVEDNKRSPFLRMVCVPIISHDNCKRMFDEKYLHPSTVCAGAFQKDSCTVW
ncbi:mastin-like [Plodia interpunctella]|uniref:mastin-like n=1 Tax=Plodia interpunctella TaxID=58824 RepID=UPI002368D0FD|nr:mastin-like [Plodia interpunctella]